MRARERERDRKRERERERKGKREGKDERNLGIIYRGGRSEDEVSHKQHYFTTLSSRQNTGQEDKQACRLSRVNRPGLCPKCIAWS